MKFNLFQPPEFKKEHLNIKNLNNSTNKKWEYSSHGRVSIYHILKPLNIKEILIPVYICSTVLEPLRRLDIKPIYYDIDLEDLNPSLESIKYFVEKYNIKAILVASMYGNPANMIEIEQYCKKNDIFMIDDAAQSFGAKLDDRYIGTFGDAGFFSFSPGKPTAGHMGSFFWSNKDYNIKRKNNCLVHYIKWLNFYIVRYKTYNYNKFIKKITTIVFKIFDKYSDVYNDSICKFEKNILGGILEANLNNKFSFRQKYFDDFIDKFANSNIRIIKHIRGTPNNHKIVICFDTIELATQFISFMASYNIIVLNGYVLLSDDLDKLPNAKSLNKKVVELPIEDDDEKMKYLFKKVGEFC